MKASVCNSVCEKTQQASEAHSPIDNSKKVDGIAHPKVSPPHEDEVVVDALNHSPFIARLIRSMQNNHTLITVVGRPRVQISDGYAHLFSVREQLDTSHDFAASEAGDGPETASPAVIL